MKKYILIIEDEEHHFDMLKKWGESMNYTVLPEKSKDMISATKNGTVNNFVIEQIKKHYKQIRLVLCDIKFGEDYLGGIDVVKKIRDYKNLSPLEWTSKIPIVGVSQYLNRAEILDAGANLVFKKNDIFEYESANEKVVRKMIKSLIDSFEAYLSHINLDSNKVFIVHGHDLALREEVAGFLKDLELHPIILSEQANLGNTIIEKIEQNSDVHYAIVLYTPCDEGRLKSEKEEQELKPRARQNVVFEHGYMVGKLGRRNVCMLYETGVEPPGDITGLVFVEKNNDWKLKLAQELKSQGFEIDLNKVIK